MRTNYSQSKIDNGIYEVQIIEVRKIMTKDGTKRMLSLDYQIRSDVGQQCAGMKINYDNITESAIRKFNWICQSVGIAEGVDDLDFYDWGDRLLGGTLRIKVVGGDQYPEIKGYFASELPPTVTNTSTDESLPF